MPFINGWLPWLNQSLSDLAAQHRFYHAGLWGATSFPSHKRAAIVVYKVNSFTKWLLISYNYFIFMCGSQLVFINILKTQYHIPSYLYVLIYKHVYHVCTIVHRGKYKALYPQKLELQIIIRHRVLLRVEPWSSARTGSVFNYWILSLFSKSYM